MKPDDLLGEWEERARLALVAYNRAANRCRTWDTRIGGLVAVLTTLVGTSVFATLEAEVTTWAKILVGIVSVGAAILSGVLVFAALPERTEQYEKAARRFGIVRRKIELARACAATDAVSTEVLDQLRTELDQAAEASPNAPYSIWRRTRRHIKGEFTRFERGSAWLRGLPPPERFKLVGPSDTDL